MNDINRKTDERIRAALKNANKRGQLDVVAAVTGIPGGVKKLREIMNGTGEIDFIDRTMLAIHLKSQ